MDEINNNNIVNYPDNISEYPDFEYLMFCSRLLEILEDKRQQEL